MATDEDIRLAALHDLSVLDTGPDETFDRLTRLAADLFGAPIAVVSLIDANRQWFKSRVGLAASETPREWAFCDHAIRGEPRSVLVIEDATRDDRFVDNPLVVGEPNIRFYAGATLTTTEGINLGTLCVIDVEARGRPTSGDLGRLRTLADMVVDAMELGRRHRAADEHEALLGLAEAMVGVGHWRFDVADGRVTWSDEVYHIHGVTRETFDPNYDAVIGFYHPDDQPAVTQQIARAIEHGEDYELNFRIIRVDGALRHVSAKAVCRRDALGKVSSLFGVFRDVTDELMARQRIEASEARYKLLAENANDLVTATDLDGRFSYVSPICHALTGYRPDEVVGRVGMSFIHRDDRPRVHACFEKALKDGGGWRVEYRIICKDERLLWVEARPTLAHDPDTGAVVGVTDVIRDVTERRAAQEAIAESEARYRSLAKNTTDVIARVSADGVLMDLSPSIEGITGYRPEELVGRRTLELTHPEDIPGLIAGFRAVMDGVKLEGQTIRYRLRRKDGAWIWLEANPTLVASKDGRIEFVDVVRDITQREAMEAALIAARTEAEAAAVAKAEFLSNMSHELRTPLSSILGFSKLLTLEPGLSDTGKRHLSRVGAAGEVLLATINDILDFSKLEARQMEVNLAPMDPAIVTAGTVDLLSTQARDKGLTLLVDLDAEAPPECLIDHKLIRQVLINLAGNAIKFTAAGQVKVSMIYQASPDRLRFEVADTGMGIAPDRIDRLFQRFSQVDGSSTRAHGGTGLGLAISKGLVEAMGGAIGVDSRAGEGSNFWFEIPARTETPWPLARKTG